MAVAEALAELLALLERTDVEHSLPLRIVKALRVSMDDLREVPIGVCIAKLAKHQDDADAKAIKAEWSALLRAPAEAHKRPESASARASGRSGTGRTVRDKWRDALRAALCYLACDDDERSRLATCVEQAAYARCAAADGDRDDKKEAYRRLVIDLVDTIGRDPLMQAMLAVDGDAGCGSSPDARDSVLGAAVDGCAGRPVSGLDLLHERLGLASSGELSQSERRSIALAQLSSRRREHHHTQQAAREAGEGVPMEPLPPPPGGESAVALVLGRLQPADWCRMAAVCREWQQCTREKTLWAAAYRIWFPPAAPTPDEGAVVAPAPAEARDAFRRRFLAASRHAHRQLVSAASRGEMGHCQRWLRFGVPVEALHKGRTALLAALEHEQWETATWLLSSWDASVRAVRERTGDGSLHLAAAGGEPDAIQSLMLYGAIDLIDERNGYRHTPLMVATHGGRVRAVRLLLQYGANPTLRADGLTALAIARHDGERKLVRILSIAVKSWREAGRPEGNASEEAEEEDEVEDDGKERGDDDEEEEEEKGESAEEERDGDEEEADGGEDHHGMGRTADGREAVAPAENGDTSIPHHGKRWRQTEAQPRALQAAPPPRKKIRIAMVEDDDADD